MIEKEEINNKNEMMIIAFMIMNDDVIGSAFSRYKSGELKTKHLSPFFRPLFRSIIKYYGTFNKAPRYTISEIFRKIRTDKDSKIIMDEYLENMSNEYAKIEEDVSVDTDYVITEAIPEFIKEQEGRLMLDKIGNAIESGRTNLIDEAVDDYIRVSDVEEDETLGTSTPYSIDAINSYYMRDPSEKIIMRLNGAVGQLMPPFYRKKLTAMTGVEKAGKSTTMMDVIYSGVKNFKASALWINCEMDEDDLNEMFWRRLTMTASDREHGGRVIYPIFDCLNNQLDRCEIKKSLNGGRLPKNDAIAYYSKIKDGWKICTQCRGQRKFTKMTKKFIPAIWFDSTRIKVIRKKIIKRAIEENKFIRLNKIRIKTFPRLAVKFTDVENYIRKYIKKAEFTPDLLVIDYPDIIAPEEGKLLDRQNVDFIWKKCAGMAHELNCSMIVADQAVKTARNKRSISRGDTSESKTKDAHLDTRITMNMTEQEEKLGILRYGLLYRRKGRTTTEQVMALQRRETGEMMRDSEWWYGQGKKEDYFVGKEEK